MTTSLRVVGAVYVRTLDMANLKVMRMYCAHPQTIHFGDQNLRSNQAYIDNRFILILFNEASFNEIVLCGLQSEKLKPTNPGSSIFISGNGLQLEKLMEKLTDPGSSP